MSKSQKIPQPSAEDALTVTEARALFHYLDKNKDCSLSETELHKQLADLGLDEQTIETLCLNFGVDARGINFDGFMEGLDCVDITVMKALLQSATAYGRTTALLAERTAALGALDIKDFREMKSLSNPPPKMLRLMTAVAMLIAPPNAAPKDLSWQGIRTLLKNVDK
jgi:hypothetical protein